MKIRGFLVTDGPKAKGLKPNKKRKLGFRPNHKIAQFMSNQEVNWAKGPTAPLH